MDTATTHPLTTPAAARAQSRHRALRWAKRAVIGLVVAAGAVFLALAFRPQPVPVDLQVAALGRLEVFVEEDGRTRVRERYVVSAPFNGTVARIQLEPGDRVMAGDVIARFDAPSAGPLDTRTRAETEARLVGAQARVRQIAAARGRAMAAHELAEKTLARSRALAAQAVVSPADLERAELEARMAGEEEASTELQGRVAEAEVSSLRAVLGRMREGGAEEITLAAPASGTVLRVLRESEGPVAAGTPLIEIGDPRQVDVVVDLLSADAVRIQAGTRAWIDRWGGEGTLTGRVRRVEPSAFTRVSALGVEEQRVNLVVALDDIPPGLGDNYRVEARLLEWSGEGVLTVPRSAIFRQRERWAVYAVSGGVASLRPVEVGHRGRLEVEIRSGLSAGDAVVLYPGERLRDGASVEPRPDT